jgi:hypothetical protein
VYETKITPTYFYAHLLYSLAKFTGATCHFTLNKSALYEILPFASGGFLVAEITSQPSYCIPNILTNLASIKHVFLQVWQQYYRQFGYCLQ